MACIWNVFRAESRRRWSSWLALVVLVALVGGTVLAGMSTARRTSSAFPHFVKHYGFDAFVFTSTPSFPRSIIELHDVRSVAVSTAFANGNGLANGQVVPGTDLGVLSLPSTRIGDTLKLIAGRLPVRPLEVVAGFSLEQQYSLHLGSVITVPFYNRSQRQRVLNSDTHQGPVLHFRVVGFEASVIDFPSNSASYSMFTSATFDDTIGRHIVTDEVGFIRLVHGAADLPRFTFSVEHMSFTGGNFAYVQSEDAASAAVQGSIHPQAVGWWLFALLAGLAGIALVGQALSRQSIVERDSYPTLSSLGVRPSQLFGLGMLRAAAIGTVGMIGAVALAFAVSPFTPVGEARAAELRGGFALDGPVFGLGAVAIVAAVLMLAGYPAWRAAQVRATQLHGDEPAARASRVVTVLAQAGAPPSMLVGTRHALERRRGRASIPVATALVGTAVAVSALAATTVFGASLSNLLATPRLYGQGWQVDLGGISYQQVTGILAGLSDSPSVTKITYGINGKYVNVNGAPVSATIVRVGKGPMVFSLIDGRYPHGDAEVALGTQTLSAAKAHIGSKVSLAIIGPTGSSKSTEVTVVGTLAFPPSLSPGGLGIGAVIPFQTATAVVCGSGPTSGSCANALVQQTSSWGMAIATTPDASGRATVAQLERQFASNLSVLSIPTNLVNFGQAVNFPLLLGVTLALFGAATLAHLLFVSVARRRREIALLKVLGLVQRQVGAMVCWQATTVAGIGVIVGVPLGLVLGDYVWRTFASNLGAVPIAVIPVGLVLAIVAGVVVFANVLALAPAALAARLHPADALRED
jgi:ABC-type antimicrobial peptide transport system permease subunit